MIFRVLNFAACLSLLTACASTSVQLPSSPEEKAIESAILWEDEDLALQTMEKLEKDSGRFEKQSNFYKVKGDLTVFGHRTTYVGMMGVDVFVGPNAVLEGNPKSIAAYISENHGAKFETGNGVYVCDYKEDIKIIIEKHPGISGSSIVIGAYTGL